MTQDLSPADRAKKAAADRAVEFVEDGMKLGLGTGSTAAWMVKALGERIREEGMQVTAVPTSSRTAAQAAEEGIIVKTLQDAKWLDLTIDGADEVDTSLNLIKGGGGAHLQEKIVATASDQMIVIADVSKQVDKLGAYPLPVEVIPFGWRTTKMLVKEALVGMDVSSTKAKLRYTGDQPFVTDEGNHILDLHLGEIGDPHMLSLVLNQVPGVVENGLFLEMCDRLVLGDTDGNAKVYDLSEGIIDRAPEGRQLENIFADLGDNDGL